MSEYWNSGDKFPLLSEILSVSIIFQNFDCFRQILTICNAFICVFRLNLTIYGRLLWIGEFISDNWCYVQFLLINMSGRWVKNVDWKSKLLKIYLCIFALLFQLLITNLRTQKAQRLDWVGYNLEITIWISQPPWGTLR